MASSYKDGSLGGSRAHENGCESLPSLGGTGDGLPRLVWILDYGAGNVRSVKNMLTYLGVEWKMIEKSEDFIGVENLIFPGVGAFGAAMEELKKRSLFEPLKDYLKKDLPFLGICIGLQCLFEGSEENEGVEGLGIIKARVKRFRPPPDSADKVPHVGWNRIKRVDKMWEKRTIAATSSFPDVIDWNQRYYFVHSYCVHLSDVPSEWQLASTTFAEQEFASAIGRGNIWASQFHPEKSSKAGIRLLRNFLRCCSDGSGRFSVECGSSDKTPVDQSINDGGLAKRVVACLDVRTNDEGRLVVTKGVNFNVRAASGDVRNLGDPVVLAEKYYLGGADEIAFLNIISFRSVPVHDHPFLELLRRVSERIFVPLVIGGGIRDIRDETGNLIASAVQVAETFFHAGADKVSIGSDAVLAAEQFYANGKRLAGNSCIEQIAAKFGRQAVVTSVDPRRVYVKSPEETRHKTIRTKQPGPNGEEFCWFQCTVKGGREARDIGAQELAEAVEALGCGELILNSIGADGTRRGFDLEMISAIRSSTSIPIIASSGAGNAQHFVDVFEKTGVEAALAAGIFHQDETSIQEVKKTMRLHGLAAR